MRTPKKKHNGETITLAIVMLLSLAWLLTHEAAPTRSATPSP
jgi:hypothetical protein